MEFDSRCYFTPPTIILGLLLCLWKWNTFLVGANILLSMCSAKSCNFGVLAGEDEHTCFYSAMLYLHFSHICTVFCQLYLSIRLSRRNWKVFLIYCFVYHTLISYLFYFALYLEIKFSRINIHLGFSSGSSLKKLPAVQDQAWSHGQDDPLEKGVTTPSSILAWRIPWTEEPGRL